MQKKETYHEKNALNWWNKLTFEEKLNKKTNCELVSKIKPITHLNISEICTIFEWSIFNPPKTNILF